MNAEVAPDDTPLKIGLTQDEASLLLLLIQSGWKQALLGSRRAYELLAATEDKLRQAGAVPAADLLKSLESSPPH